MEPSTTTQRISRSAINDAREALYAVFRENLASHGISGPISDGNKTFFDNDRNLVEVALQTVASLWRGEIPTREDGEEAEEREEAAVDPYIPAAVREACIKKLAHRLDYLRDENGDLCGLPPEKEFRAFFDRLPPSRFLTWAALIGLRAIRAAPEGTTGIRVLDEWAPDS